MSEQEGGPATPHSPGRRGGQEGGGGAVTRPAISPASPFPYGSPLARASPGQRLLLGSSLNRGPGQEVLTPRLKGEDLYGG